MAKCSGIRGGAAEHVVGDIVRDLPIPRPFTLERFVGRLSERRGRTIELVASWLGASAPCGLLVSTDDVDYVCYASNTSRLHQLHIILHEIGHLQLGHRSRRITMLLAQPKRSPPPDAVADEVADEIAPAREESLGALEALLPRLSPTLIRRLLGRTAYVDAHERDAEVFATLAGDRISRVLAPADHRIPHDTVPHDLGVLGLQSLFGVPPPLRGDLSA